MFYFLIKGNIYWSSSASEPMVYSHTHMSTFTMNSSWTLFTMCNIPDNHTWIPPWVRFPSTLWHTACPELVRSQGNCYFRWSHSSLVFAFCWMLWDEFKTCMHSNVRHHTSIFSMLDYTGDIMQFEMLQFIEYCEIRVETYW